MGTEDSWSTPACSCTYEENEKQNKTYFTFRPPSLALIMLESLFNQGSLPPNKITMLRYSTADICFSYKFHISIEMLNDSSIFAEE